MMKTRSALVARGLAALAALVTGIAASAAPYTLPLVYEHSGAYTMSGSVTFDDALLAPNTLAGDAIDTSGLIDVTLVATGPGIPGGTTTFTYADMNAWYFSTDGSGRISDINFFGNPNDVGCLLEGVITFVTDIVCGEDSLASLRLNLTATAPSVPVPALSAGALAALSGALVLLALAALRSRRRVPGREA